MGPPGRLDTDFIFQYFKFQIKIFGVSKRWVLSVSLQLKLRHRASTLQIIPLNISLFTSQCNADFGNRTLELKIPFCTFKGLQFNKELSSMRHLCLQRQIECLKRASLAAAFPIIVTDYCNFPLTMKTTHNTQYFFSQLFCSLILTLRSIFHNNAVALWT